MTAFELFGDAAGSDAGFFLSRVLRYDPEALVRIRHHEAGAVALWAWLPVGVLAARGLPGEVGADAVTRAAWLVDRLTDQGQRLELTDRRDAQWRGPLPAGGFRRLDAVPADVLAGLAAAGERTFAEVAAGVTSSSGSRAVGEAVLDHIALTVTDGVDAAEVPQRLVQSLAALRFLGADDVGVDVTPAWLRLSATHGAVHLRRGPSLGLSPA
jgi:hypothetical protein